MMKRNGLALMALATVATLLASAVTAQTTFTRTPALAIPDNTSVSDNMVVSGMGTSIDSLRCDLRINHTWDSDMRIFLIPPGVTWAGPFSGAPPAGVVSLCVARGGSGDNFGTGATSPFVYTQISSATDPLTPGTIAITGGVAPFTTGVYTADVPASFAARYGTNPNGTWTLAIADTATGDTGTVLEWRLVIRTVPVLPTITSLTPNTGSTLGGTSVVIAGTNFTGATAVAFGATAATGFTVNSATQITATAPAGAAGTVNVSVTTPAGTSANVVADDYTYAVIAPTITGLAPTSGAVAGGTSVVITGTAFTGATAVAFGATAATGFTVDSSTQITATAPAGTAGVVDVSVTTPSGTSANTGADDYTYIPAPAVGGLAPSSGPIAGGTTVVITGTDFNGATAVAFGANPATTYTVDSNTQITATAPAGAAGTVDVIVTTGGGASANTAADDYVYVAPEMDVTRGATAVADAGANDTIGAVPFGIAQTATYTITNSGTAGLNLTGTTVVVVTAGTNCTSATVTTAPASTSIAAAASVTFTITYTVTAAGAFDFAVSIDNDDANENPYTWTADGTGASIPEMDVTRTGAVADGGTDALGSAPEDAAIVLTYTITNNGNTTLNITNPVSISGITNCTCVVTTPPAATVAAAATTTVVITITPTAAGAFGALVSIVNDDSDENPYNWTISGTATTAGGGGGGGGGNDEGCSTGENNNALMMLAGLMATFGLALRLRRKMA